MLNGLTGAVLRPRTNAVRLERGPDERGVTQDGANAFRMVKKRMMIDIRYSLYALEELAARERECLILSAIVYALQDHIIKTM